MLLFYVVPFFEVSTTTLTATKLCYHNVIKLVLKYYLILSILFISDKDLSNSSIFSLKAKFEIE